MGTCSQVSCAVVSFQMAAGSETCQGRKRNIDRFGVVFAWSCDHVSVCGEAFHLPVSDGAVEKRVGFRRFEILAAFKSKKQPIWE